MGMLTDRPELYYKALFKDTGWSTVITLENWFNDFVNELERVRQYYTKLDLRTAMYPSLMTTLSFIKHCSPDELKLVILSKPDTFTNGSGLGSILDEFTSRQLIFLEVLLEGNNLPSKIDSNFNYYKEQGVMFMPSSLTNSIFAPKDHSKIWFSLVQRLMKLVNERCAPVWLIVGDLDRYTDALPISNMDVKMPELTIENLPLLDQVNVFGKVNELIHKYLKREKIRWT